MTVPRLAPALAALLAGLALALLVAACGDEDRSGLLPSSDAQTLLDQLDGVRGRVADGECSALTADLAELRGAVLNLPSSVDEQLRARLDEGVQNLAEIAPPECTGQTVTTEEPQETPTPDTETQTQTIETTTTPEPTATPTATPEPTPTPDTGGVEPVEPAATPTPDPGGAGGAPGEEVLP